MYFTVFYCFKKNPNVKKILQQNTLIIRRYIFIIQIFMEKWKISIIEKYTFIMKKKHFIKKHNFVIQIFMLKIFLSQKKIFITKKYIFIRKNTFLL